VDKDPPNERISFTVVGNDQGLLGTPTTVDELIMGPAERYEVLISFNGHQNQVITLRNSEATLLGPGMSRFVSW